MKTMLDILGQASFREKLLSLLNDYNIKYTLPKKLPLLYHYKSFSNYAIDNLVNEGFSMSLIATFNDCYDSNLSFGNIQNHAIREYEDMAQLYKSVGYSCPLSAEDWRMQLIYEQQAYKGFLDTFHCVCFSECNNSTLMWSHYADNCRGICIEYNFQRIKEKQFLNLLFPVCYTEKPIDIYELVRKEKGIEFSVELGVLTSMLNKALCWEYEKEWRLVFLDEGLGNYEIDNYVNFSNIIRANKIILGQNFLDNFIPELNGNKNNPLELLEKLIAFSIKNNIPIYIMRSEQNSFMQYEHKIDNASVIADFIYDNLKIREFCCLKNRKHLYIFFEEYLDEKS